MRAASVLCAEQTRVCVYFVYGWTVGLACRDEVNEVATKFWYLAAAALVCAYMQVYCFMWSSVRQGRRLRRAYFRALLHQDMGWFDEQETGALVTHLV